MKAKILISDKLLVCLRTHYSARLEHPGVVKSSCSHLCPPPPEPLWTSVLEVPPPPEPQRALNFPPHPRHSWHRKTCLANCVGYVTRDVYNCQSAFLSTLLGCNSSQTKTKTTTTKLYVNLFLKLMKSKYSDSHWLLKLYKSGLKTSLHPYRLALMSPHFLPLHLDPPPA